MHWEAPRPAGDPIPSADGPASSQQQDGAASSSGGAGEGNAARRKLVVEVSLRRVSGGGSGGRRARAYAPRFPKVRRCAALAAHWHHLMVLAINVLFLHALVPPSHNSLRMLVRVIYLCQGMCNCPPLHRNMLILHDSARLCDMLKQPCASFRLCAQ